MDMALAAAQNMAPGDTIIESVMDQESMSDGEFDEEFDTQSQMSYGSIISPGISPAMTGGKHPYLHSGISTGSNVIEAISTFKITQMNDNIETEEIDEIDIDSRAKDENFNASPQEVTESS